ncbi:MAG TPA: signal peptidase I [Terriglobales bacterium]|nr:signal peptidase I [Terriglobales bacterium]
MAAGAVLFASSGAASLAEARALVPFRRRRWYRAARWLATVLLAVFFVRTFLGEASVVPTGSMEGTILTGDHIFLNKALYGPELPLVGWRLPRLRTPRRGDIVAFRYPRDPRITFLKRVVAIGGDTVEIRDDALYVNGAPVPEPYVQHRLHARTARRENYPAQKIAPGSLFVLGDNRDDSADSRYWGTVPAANVVGEPILVYFSYDAPARDWLEDNGTRKLEFYGSMAAHLFSRTRWQRIGTLL